MVKRLRHHPFTVVTGCTRLGERQNFYARTLRANNRCKAIPLGVKSGVEKLNIYHGSMVKRLRHHPFTVVTGVRFPLESP